MNGRSFLVSVCLLCVGIGLFPQAAYADVARVGSWATGLTHTAGAGSDRLLVFLVGYEHANTDIGVTSVSYPNLNGLEKIATIFTRFRGSR
jgi:hypothetical protein